MDRTRVYDIIYALAARDGREAALFGNCGPAAREAFARSLAGEAFPELWFEVPLAGEPWMDFHSLVSHDDVAGTRASYAGHGGAYAGALSWFAGQEPQTVRQLALSYDTHAGDVDRPAVQVLLDGRDVRGHRPCRRCRHRVPAEGRRRALGARRVHRGRRVPGRLCA